MGILENCTDLWYLMSDFFHKHKCCNGFIDPKDDDFYSFMKRGYIFGVRRINQNSYKLRVLHINKNIDNRYILKSLDEVESTILQYF